MSIPEKRSIKRHHLKEYIHLDGGSSLIPGQTVDISRNGMKVLVKRSDDFDSRDQISVNIPGSGGEGIPCRIRRKEKGSDFWEIGLEFDGESDARLLLVERWLESLENGNAGTDSAPTESRQVPRTRCSLRGMISTNPNIEILSTEDLSLDGMLLRARGKLKRDDQLSLELTLDDERRPIPFSARVAYVGEEDAAGIFDLGIAVEKMKEIHRNRLRTFIINIASGAAVLEYRKLLEKAEPSREFRIDGREAGNLIRQMAEISQTANLLDEKGLRIVETRLENPLEESFQAPSPQPEVNKESTFFSFIREGSAYSFSARLISWSEGSGLYKYPECVFRGEKRAGQRNSTEGSVRLIFPHSDAGIDGRILDSSRRGLLCEISPENLEGKMPKPGGAVQLELESGMVPGEIRHIDTVESRSGDTVLHLGIETGIIRRIPEKRHYSAAEWSRTWEAPSRPLNDSSLIRPHVVEYTERSGRRIVALLHTNVTDNDEACTVVVIPPAFGKKKEALAPLALTLMAHFEAAGAKVAILRYDGIDRPGESDNSTGYARRGYEMLGYRIDQGYTDLEASMRWARNNPYFHPEKIVLISSSMAALDARRLQSDASAPRADYWISVMGVSSSQGALRNILGGLDVIANHRMGLPIGTMGMLGQLIDMDRMASDMTQLGYAVAADARWNMSRVESPITWIYGTHDKWMIAEEIEDVMSIEAPGDRELIEIPTAHNLRSSEDALSAFKLISNAILSRMVGKTIPPVSPDKTELMDLLTRERERVISEERLDKKSYWKTYLLGENSGEDAYDFYKRLREFQDFLNVEVDMLNPRPGESIADMGCGTGLVSEAILARIGNLAAAGSGVEGTRFTAIDLVGEALVKAEEKYRQLCLSRKALEEVDDSWIAMDLEPDPLAGIRKIVDREDAIIQSLEGRVKGLGPETVDHISNCPRETISQWLRGDRPDKAMKDRLEEYLSTRDIMILTDLNRAARFIKGRLEEEDLKPSRRHGTGRIKPERQAVLRTGDIFSSILDFGDRSGDGKLPVMDETFHGISASLFLSYLFAPEEAVSEFFRMLLPGGRLVISTMKPDSDISTIFTQYIAEQSSADSKRERSVSREKNLRDARMMLNEAAALFSLEEEGWFRFFDEYELISMMRNAGFTNIKTCESLGNPPQAIIVSGIKKTV